MQSVENKPAYIMVAPNGARKTKADHPNIPMSVAEMLECAKSCWAEGAKALHAHVRDANGNHVLDAGQYGELIAEMGQILPDMEVQITTESLGQYSPQEQRRLVCELRPKSVSVALREQNPESDEAATRRFYHWADEAGVLIQHILYSPADVQRLVVMQRRSVIPNIAQRALFVLGRYSDGLPSNPKNLQNFLNCAPQGLRWMACAFGRTETACLHEAYSLGGELRVGFENNEMNTDGGKAHSNAERVRDLVATLKLNKEVSVVRVFGTKGGLN